MKTTLRHTFEIGADAFWRDIFFDHAFVERMYKEALGCTSVAFIEDSGDTSSGRSRRLTFTQRMEAPAPVRKLFGETTTMEERGDFDVQAKRWRFTMIPDRMPDKIRISGETWIEPAGEGKIERIMELEFSVSLFGVGGLVEKFMASATAESFAKQVEFIRDHIRRRATSSS
jgi:Protein of unknown function (DUF2505)